MSPHVERLVHLLLPQTLWGLQRTVSVTDWKRTFKHTFYFSYNVPISFLQFKRLQVFPVGPPGPLGGPWALGLPVGLHPGLLLTRSGGSSQGWWGKESACPLAEA